MMDAVLSHLRENKLLMERLGEQLLELAQSLKVNHKINLKNMEVFNLVTEGLNKLQQHNLNLLKELKSFKEKENPSPLGIGCFYEKNKNQF
jgi:hypothetical protein